ncbi:hypothetical protein [Moheibacter sp.]|uniref:hypothetical protein n=1 Tax=Moheibacter sp. TaxID=1965316 RepID=UPI003C735F0D
MNTKIFSIKLNSFLFILSLSMFISCKVHKISDESKEWQPYKKKDILIFKSSKGEFDTIWIKKVSFETAVNDNLSFNPNRFQTLSVTGEISLQRPYPLQRGLPIRRTFINMLSIYANDPDYLSLDFTKRLDTLRYSPTRVSIDELSKLEVESPRFKHNSFEIKSESSPVNPNLIYLTKYWWSKEYGYVRYEFSNGYYWELQQFIRDGKNILP